MVPLLQDHQGSRGNQRIIVVAPETLDETHSDTMSGLGLELWIACREM